MFFPTPIHEKVALAHEGKNPNAIIRLEASWVVLADVQPLRGYCILLSDPVVSSLNEMDETTRAAYCRDMGHVGDALLEVLGATRINYETWCNKDPALHTHIVPRYLREPLEKRILPPREAYDFAKARKFDASVDTDLIQQLRENLRRYKR